MYKHQAMERSISAYQLLEEEAANLELGESGLLALDWWNGKRPVLVNANLSELLVGMTLGKRSSEIYRALSEATAARSESR
jgi:L-ribulokinase